jgi:hypothetical protein
MSFPSNKTQLLKADLGKIFPGGDVHILAHRNDGILGFKVVVQEINSVQVASLHELNQREQCETTLKRSGTGICVSISN